MQLVNLACATANPYLDDPMPNGCWSLGMFGKGCLQDEPLYGKRCYGKSVT